MRKSVIFHDATTPTSPVEPPYGGEKLAVHPADSFLLFEITGEDIEGMSVDFEGCYEDTGDWYLINCINLSTGQGANKTTALGVAHGTGQIYKMDLKGLSHVRFRVATLTAGSVTIKGRVF